MSQKLLDSIPESPFTLSENHQVTLSLGQLYLNIQHQPLEWHTEYIFGRPIHGKSIFQYGTLTIERYVVNHENNSELSISPMLATRPIVSRPMEPISIAAGNQAKIYIGTPLFIAINVDGIKLKELPLVVLSDTWFGPSTRQGELCYSTTTKARLDPNLLKSEGYKAVTPLHITNRGDKSLTLDRINLPVPVLSLYRQSNNDYITSTISVDLQDDINDAKISINAPDNESTLVKVCEPRRPLQKKFFYRTLDLLFA